MQPGSLDSEAGIFQMKFDQSGSRLITCEADKTIKVKLNSIIQGIIHMNDNALFQIYKEDDSATEETNPINWKPEILKRRRY